MCLHLFHECGRSPLWPVFSARTKEEAQEVQAKVLRFASSLDPEADQNLITSALEAWALATGWSKGHRVVWRRSVATSSVSIHVETPSNVAP